MSCKHAYGSLQELRACLCVSILQKVRDGVGHDMVEFIDELRPLSPGVLEDVVGQVQHCYLPVHGRLGKLYLPESNNPLGILHSTVVVCRLKIPRLG